MTSRQLLICWDFNSKAYFLSVIGTSQIGGEKKLLTLMVLSTNCDIESKKVFKYGSIVCILTSLFRECLVNCSLGLF